ncbi:DUF427 domain-containing protein [Iamia sp.]|uniref:DUF427 domain-containing protein n=1 Tax=Iamia sp. TaxID=2722710 RepID=UPI002C7CFF41|nr:DUF427 domain-containing protein [Iamia sp.]HXH57415.1 DUF427 domain-containing protein [Iamia sp.]
MDQPVPIAPGPGQESVWDYPRPPRLETTPKRLVVEHGGRIVGDTTRGLRVTETSQAPAYYLPEADIDLGLLRTATTRSFCEWKGTASYADLVVEPGDGPAVVARAAAWTYLHPVEAFAALVGHWSFFPQAVDRCLVDDEVVTPMEGGVYGGWVTPDIVGPIKGGPGTAYW